MANRAGIEAYSRALREEAKMARRGALHVRRRTVVTPEVEDVAVQEAEVEEEVVVEQEADGGDDGQSEEGGAKQVTPVKKRKAKNKKAETEE